VKKLYVGNLAFQATEEQLRAEFENEGIATESVTVLRDRESGRSRGFGFVEISQDTDLDRATALNGRALMGRAIVVNEARPRPEYRSHGHANVARNWENRSRSGKRRPEW
jgi:RNA recognition motif-containing protein